MDPAPMFELIPYQRFRDTPAVRFFDVTIADSYARDLVIHAGPAVSPPDDRPAHFIDRFLMRRDQWL